MKKNQKSIGGILYFEWLILIIDYFKSIELKERVFDVFVPLGIGIIISTTCMLNKIAARWPAKAVTQFFFS